MSAIFRLGDRLVARCPLEPEDQEPPPARPSGGCTPTHGRHAFGTPEPRSHARAIATFSRRCQGGFLAASPPGPNRGAVEFVHDFGQSLAPCAPGELVAIARGRRTGRATCRHWRIGSPPAPAHRRSWTERGRCREPTGPSALPAGSRAKDGSGCVPSGPVSGVPHTEAAGPCRLHEGPPGAQGYTSEVAQAVRAPGAGSDAGDVRYPGRPGRRVAPHLALNAEGRVAPCVIAQD